ncbi:MAG: hypothetical protein HY505_01300 [Candidatus Yanofskybacteria bacterium]|nr:hypothetical protein [Candidatus Yanofskybacteria bacterium]
MTEKLKLSDFGILADKGFLPRQDPCASLSSDWEFLDEFGKKIPKLINSGKIMEASRDLLIPSNEMLNTMNEAEINRAMMIYGFGASAYIHSSVPSQNLLCRNLAKPFVWLSSHSGKPPILSYCSYSLNNWKRIDPTKDIEADNLKLLQNFIDLYDEDWFILIHIDIERKASLAIGAAANAISSAKDESLGYLCFDLRTINRSLKMMINTLKRMPEHCSPDVYYKRVRPWIKYFDNVVYEGVEELNNQPQSFRGETGAQSSIMPFLEATLSLPHEESVLTQHLRIMRLYMPLKHQLLIKAAEETSNIREFIIRSGSKELKESYNECLERISEFRDIHFSYAHSYIHQKTTDPKGTGGTIFMPWLEQMKNETGQMLLK